MKPNTSDDQDGPILEIENLAVSYFTRGGEVPAVTDVSLTLRQRESFGLVGESGCGKSTVAMAIMRYLGANGAVVRGRILFNGRDMATMSSEELQRIRGSRIAMVYQEPMSALNPSLTIGQQLIEIPQIHDGATKKDARDRAAQILKDVRMSDPVSVMSRYPHQLSGGQQQRVVIAMALLSNPSLLLLDEPTTALDVTVAAAVVDLIAELREKYDTSLIYISHNLGLIVKVCDRVGIMYSGEIVEEGTVRDVFRRSTHPYTVGLLECIPTFEAHKNSRTLRPIRGQVSAPRNRPHGCAFGPRCDYFVAGQCDQEHVPLEAIAEAEDHSVRCCRWRDIETRIAAIQESGVGTVDSATPEILRVEELTKFYHQPAQPFRIFLSNQVVQAIKANERLNFRVRTGEIVGIVGESGCGKSTLAKVLIGLETATSGRVAFQGRDIASVPVSKRGHDLIRAVQIVFQDPDGTLNPHHSVGYAVERAVRKLGDLSGNIPPKRMAGDLLALVGLSREYAARKPHQLSGGQKQRVAIARAFAGSPSLVIADEPVSALDVSVQAAIVNLLLDVQRKYDTSLLFISHDLSLISYLSDYVVVMYLGQIMEAGPMEDVLHPPYHPYTEALLSAAPVPNPDVEQHRVRLEGDLPSAMNTPKGCRFATRCPLKLGAICDEEEPPEIMVTARHRIKCHIPLETLQSRLPIFATSARTIA